MTTLVVSDNSTTSYDQITLFAQVIALLPKEIIRKIIRDAGTDKHCKGYNTWIQLVSMIFCQFSNCTPSVIFPTD